MKLKVHFSLEDDNDIEMTKAKMRLWTKEYQIDFRFFDDEPLKTICASDLLICQLDWSIKDGIYQASQQAKHQAKKKK